MTVRAVSLGCRLNGAEAETMRRRALAAGLADLTIVNTCAVTAEASRRSGQAIRRAARDRPRARIVAAGCAAAIEPDRFAGLPGVAAVLDREESDDPGTWARLAGSPVPPDSVEAASDASLGRVRSFVAVQSGCDHDCTFCIIPRGRGRSRSVRGEAVVAAIRDAVVQGSREVVLTGVDLTAYGPDLGEGALLGRLVRQVLRAVPDLPRLRLSSIDAAEIDPDLLAAFAEEPRLMPHLHLSLQAGDETILKRMKRRHTRADALRLCHTLRETRPDIVFGADLIAGFPTETEAMFARSLDLVAECGLTYLHVFPFSPRPGTPAARMPQVPPALVQDRATRLRAAGEAALGAYLEGEIGRVRRVLFEASGLGRTEGFAPVRVAGPVGRGELREVRIAARDGAELRGV